MAAGRRRGRGPGARGRALGTALGLVDVRAEIDDPQSFRGWFAGACRALRAPPPVPRARSAPPGGPSRRARRPRRVPRRSGAGEGRGGDDHRAERRCSAGTSPRTRQNLGAKRCVQQTPAPCAGRTVLRLFAGPGGRRFWNTRLLANGGYRLTVTAWDAEATEPPGRSPSSSRTERRSELRVFPPVASAAERHGPGGPAGLQNLWVAAPRSVGSTPARSVTGAAGIHAGNARPADDLAASSGLRPRPRVLVAANVAERKAALAGAFLVWCANCSRATLHADQTAGASTRPRR